MVGCGSFLFLDDDDLNVKLARSKTYPMVKLVYMC